MPINSDKKLVDALLKGLANADPDADDERFWQRAESIPPEYLFLPPDPGEGESDAMTTTLPDVRILPMNPELEFQGRSIEEVQRSFFLKELQGDGRPPGKYWYREAGLNAESGTIVLFQYEGKLIASATLIEVERFKASEGGTYKGALYFDPKSVRVFDPVGSDVVSSIWPEFKRFSRVKRKLNPKGYPTFEKKLTGVEGPAQ